MSVGEIKNTHEVTFESLRHVDDSGTEYWLARELQPVLEYGEWRNFRRVIGKAMTAAETAETPVQSHFVEVNKLVTTGLGTEREIEDFELSRYACYLIVQNGDPSKPVRTCPRQTAARRSSSASRSGWMAGMSSSVGTPRI